MRLLVYYNINEIDYIVKIIQCFERKTICLKGELGVGKTTLSKKYISLISQQAKQVDSPSYSIIKEYYSKELLIYHIDCYRVNSIEEALELGLDDYINSGNICIIEWPERIQELLPPDCAYLNLEIISETERRLEILL